MNTRVTVCSLRFIYSFFLILLLGALAYGQEGTIDSITVTPTNPSTDDHIAAEISGTVPDTCWVVSVVSAELSGWGVSLDMVMSKKPSCFSFPGKPTSWEKTARVDPLPAGNYRIIAELRDAAGTLKDYMTTSFFVLDYTDITAVQIIQMRSSLLTNLHIGDPLTLMTDAIGPDGTALLHRFFYRFGYGTPAWADSAWQLEQDWSPSNSVFYTFTEPGNYYVIGHVKAEGTDWKSGDPQGGFVVNVQE